LLTYPEADIQ